MSISIEQLSSLDSQSHTNTQVQLYDCQLQYNPNQPLHQHVLYLDNYLDDDQNIAVFQSAVKDIISLHPSSRVKQLCKQFLSISKQLDDNENEESIQQLRETIRQQLSKLKQQIQSQKHQINYLTSTNAQYQQQNLSICQQIKSYIQHIKQNQIYLNYIPQHNQQLSNTTQEFLQIKQNLANNTLELLKDFKKQYNTIVYEYQCQQQLINNYNTHKTDKQKLEKQINLASQNKIELYATINQLKDIISKEKENNHEQNLDNRSVCLSEQTSNSNTETQYIKKVKSHIHYPQHNSKYQLYTGGLLFATTLLLIITISLYLL